MNPFTEEEFKKLEEELNSITTFLPEDKMSYIWASVQRLRTKKTPQPCACKSSAKHWGQAVKDLKEFINEQKESK